MGYSKYSIMDYDVLSTLQVVHYLVIVFNTLEFNNKIN